MEAQLLAFIGIAIIITVTPGPDFALVTRVALGRGRVAGWLASLGVVSGHLLWGVASAIGVSALLHASAPLYTLLRLIGAAYLIWLGLQALISPTTTHEETPLPELTSRAVSYRQGLVSDLLNPKIGAFYTTLLPQFIAPGQPIFLTSILLAAIFALIVAVWLAVCVMILARAGEIFRRPSVRRSMERIAGAVLIGLGIRLAADEQ